MSYCSIDDVKVVLRGTTGELPQSGNVLDDDQILQSITDAQVEIDLALSQFYVTPLNPVPDTIKILTQDIAAYLADLIFRMSKPYTGINPYQLRYNRARLLLDGIVKGTYYIDVPDDNLRTTTSEVINPYDGDLITLGMLFGPALHGHSSFVGVGTNNSTGEISQNDLGLFP